MTQLNARIGKSHPAAHQGEAAPQEDHPESWIEPIVVGVVCVIAIICAALPAFMP